MDTRADVIRLCMGLPDSYEDYPFDDPNWTAIGARLACAGATDDKDVGVVLMLIAVDSDVEMLRQ